MKFIGRYFLGAGLLSAAGAEAGALVPSACGWIVRLLLETGGKVMEPGLVFLAGVAGVTGGLMGWLSFC